MGRSQEGRTVPRLSDEELEFLGEFYLTRSIRAAGVNFVNFLNNAEYYIAKYGRGDRRRQTRAERFAQWLRRLFRVRIDPRASA
jgi:hypothetical protein